MIDIIAGLVAMGLIAVGLGMYITLLNKLDKIQSDVGHILWTALVMHKHLPMTHQYVDRELRVAIGILRKFNKEHADSIPENLN